MNAKRHYNRIIILSLLLIAVSAHAKSAKKQVAEGNALYQQKEYAKAAEKYEFVLKDHPEAAEAQYNKANSLYQQEKFDEAIDLYRKASVHTQDKKLVEKAKYNLGNSYFKQGLQQKDEPEKAIESFENSIHSWRQAQQMNPANKRIEKNIELAKMTIQQLKQGEFIIFNLVCDSFWPIGCIPVLMRHSSSLSVDVYRHAVWQSCFLCAFANGTSRSGRCRGCREEGSAQVA